MSWAHLEHGKQSAVLAVEQIQVADFGSAIERLGVHEFQVQLLVQFELLVRLTEKQVLPDFRALHLDDLGLAKAGAFCQQYQFFCTKAYALYAGWMVEFFNLQELVHKQNLAAPAQAHNEFFPDPHRCNAGAFQLGAGNLARLALNFLSRESFTELVPA